MRIFCTYCSASKDPDKGLIPAFRRYISPRIILVQELAEKEDAYFCILSGKFGLVDWDQPLPWYDHLLIRDEVQNLVETVINQIHQKYITEVDYYTRSPLVDQNIVPYMNTIEKACYLSSIELKVFTIEEPKISATIRNWKLIMEMAAEARQKLLSNRLNGEVEFQKLLALFPDDGMVYFQRGSGYEALGDLLIARDDYESAKKLFPLDRWQWEAQEAISRIDQNISKGGTLSEACKRLLNLNGLDNKFITDVAKIINKTTDDPIRVAFELRRHLDFFVKQLLSENEIESSYLEKNIETLRNLGLIPEIIVNHMNTVRIIGNRAAHPEPGESLLKSTDIYPSISAFLAILEWKNLKIST